MVKQFLLIIGFLFSIQVMSQTGIGTTTPHASAKLDVSATDKGFLPPRVALTSTNLASPINSPANGLMVFNTASAGASPFNVVPGYYYWDGTGQQWVSISTTVGNVQNQAIFRSTSNTSAGSAITSWNARFNNISSGDLAIYSLTEFTLSNGIYKIEWALPFQSSNTYNTMVLQEFSSGSWGTFRGDAAYASLSNGGNTDWGGGTFAADILDCSSAPKTIRIINNDGASRTLFKGVTLIITKLNPSVTTSTTADNLGNHIATSNIQLNNNYLSNDGGNEGIRVDNSGNVGIGTNTPTEKLEVSGNVKATNFIGTASTALSAPTNITFGEIDVPQVLSVNTGFVDLANIPLPSAGKYKITYVVRGSVTTNATLSVLLLRNGSNTQVSGTEAMAIYNAANIQVTCTQVCIVTTTAAETYKLSVWTQSGAGNFNVINDGNGRSKVLWEKLN